MCMFEVSLEAFETFVKEGVEAIPGKFRSRITNVAFLIDENPTVEQRKQNKLRPHETLLGLYEGIPRPARGENYGGLVMPDRITIFKKPIETEALLLVEERFSNSIHVYTIAKSADAEKERVFRFEVRKLVMDTVWHEVAHHFGLGEERVEEREKEREKRRHKP